MVTQNNGFFFVMLACYLHVFTYNFAFILDISVYFSDIFMRFISIFYFSLFRLSNITEFLLGPNFSYTEKETWEKNYVSDLIHVISGLNVFGAFRNDSTCCSSCIPDVYTDVIPIVPF